MAKPEDLKLGTERYANVKSLRTKAAQVLSYKVSGLASLLGVTANPAYQNIDDILNQRLPVRGSPGPNCEPSHNEVEMGSIDKVVQGHMGPRRLPVFRRHDLVEQNSPEVDVMLRPSEISAAAAVPSPLSTSSTSKNLDDSPLVNNVEPEAPGWKPSLLRRPQWMGKLDMGPSGPKFSFEEHLAKIEQLRSQSTSKEAFKEQLKNYKKQRKEEKKEKIERLWSSDPCKKMHGLLSPVTTASDRSDQEDVEVSPQPEPVDPCPMSDFQPFVFHWIGSKIAPKVDQVATKLRTKFYGQLDDCTEQWRSAGSNVVSSMSSPWPALTSPFTSSLGYDGTQDSQVAPGPAEIDPEQFNIGELDRLTAGQLTGTPLRAEDMNMAPAAGGFVSGASMETSSVPQFNPVYGSLDEPNVWADNVQYNTAPPPTQMSSSSPANDIQVEIETPGKSAQPDITAVLPRNVPEIQQRFERASETAYHKLIRAAPSQSPAYQQFVTQIGGHDNLIRRGFDSLNRILSHDASLSLLDVYSFLHVAYAISQTETNNPSRSTPAEFRCGIGTFRSLLGDSKLCMDQRGTSEAELFDEIVDVMWSELDYAISWIGKNTGWNWGFMADVSSKAERLQFARDMLREAAANEEDPGGEFLVDLDPDPPDGMQEVSCEFHEPSFVREAQEWEREGGAAILETNVGYRPEDSIPRLVKDSNRPPDQTKWWDLVTSSIFFIVIGFLQVLQKTQEPFEYMPKAPYSLLYFANPETDMLLPATYRQYLKTSHAKVFAPALKRHVADSPAVIQPLVDVAVNLAAEGVLATIRHFENYLLALRKVFKLSQDEDSAVVDGILSACWTCSRDLQDTSPWRIIPIGDQPYGPEYVAQRIVDEYEAYSASSAPASSTAVVIDVTPTVSSVEMDLEQDDFSSILDLTMHDTPSVSEEPYISVSASTGAFTLSPNSSQTTLSTIKSDEGSESSSPKNLHCTKPDCDKTFSTQSNLNRHLRNHHSTGVSRRYHCPDCGEGFSRRDNMYKHRDVYHFVPRGVKKKRRA